MRAVELEDASQKIVCADIRCKEELGYFDIKKGRRFCRKCRIFHKILLWKCATKNCKNIISSCMCRETRKFCDDCRGYGNNKEYHHIS